MTDGVDAPTTSAGAGGDVPRGLTLVVAGTLILPGIDAFAKYLSATVSPGEVVWARFLFQSLFLLPLVLYRRGPVPPLRRWPVHFARGALLALTTVLYFAALRYLPLADAIAIFFVEPFILTLLSVVFLKETIGWRRVAAICFGFAGAMVVVQPSYALVGLPALFPLAAAVCFAGYLALTRALAVGDDPIVMQFSAGVSSTVLMTVALAIGGAAEIAVLAPSLPTAHEWLLLVLLGLLATVSHTVIVYAFRYAGAGILAPFQYLEIIGATILGLIVFGDFPTPLTWLGVAMIVGSGLYVFHRERQLARRAGAAG